MQGIGYHAVGFEFTQVRVAKRIVAQSAAKAHRAAESCDGHRRVGCRATAAGVHIGRAQFFIRRRMVGRIKINVHTRIAYA